MQLIFVTEEIEEYLVPELEGKSWVDSKHIKVIHGVECFIDDP